MNKILKKLQEEAKKKEQELQKQLQELATKEEAIKEQQEKFDEQSGAIEMWDEEATSGDDEFVLAMEYGMPPQSGWGMRIERILALLTGQDNLRDVFLFPLMKPEEGNWGD